MGARADMTLADAGYFGAGAGGVRQQGPSGGDARVPAPLRRPYHKDRFTYDESSDSYRCPQGQALRFIRIKRNWGADAAVPDLRRRLPGVSCLRDLYEGRSLWSRTGDRASRRSGFDRGGEPVYERRRADRAGLRETSCCAASPMSRPNGRCWPGLQPAHIWPGADMWRHGRTSWTATSARIWGCQERQTAILPAHGLP